MSSDDVRGRKFNATWNGGGPLAAPLTLDTLLSSARGDASGAWLLSVAAQLMFPRVQLAGDFAAKGAIDDAYAKRFFASAAGRESAIGNATSSFIWSGGRLVRAWPDNPDDKLYNHVRDSNVATLLVGGALDFSTPPQVAARELLPHLPNGQQVVLPKLGHTEDVWAYEPAASTRLIETFLDSGKVDTSLYSENRLDLTPSVTHATMAKIVLGVMLGLAALTVLSLLVMALRVRWRGAFGRKTSGALRSLYVLLLGLGGLLLGMLIVLTALPTVALTDELFAALSVGVPIGHLLRLGQPRLGLEDEGNRLRGGDGRSARRCLAGVQRHRRAPCAPHRDRRSGGRREPNLLALDIAWDLQARTRLAATKAKETLAPHAATG